ncbi:hypothetical protein JOB18_032255 [Solea senegalensis]|uniref:SEFIR domain-containing protein n=1 Tax=Solea senegalensis TaxID=28829 RepID=A0AAV6QZ74_SOLSE|nr:interleukin 17 receptor A1a isoform X1 [Solea senegalensis]KAG7497132.1 hypothetical protein JOB18_032255 [Solea senegalensis]
MFINGILLLLPLLQCASLSSAVTVLTWPPLSCPRQDLNCTVNTSNCLDIRWLDMNDYTPGSPDELQVSVETRQDEAGHLQPVLAANWKIKDDGSIRYLKATELQVLVMSTNQNLCIRYSFQGTLPMRSPSGEKWSFSANMVVLEPGQRYLISVFNIPKPELLHSNYDVSKEVIVPDCQDSSMQKTQFCIERGSQWEANISLATIPTVKGRFVLAVGFSPDSLCDEYLVIVRCSTFHVQHVYRDNHTTLNVTFSLDKWPRSCCQFHVEIKPFFPQCGQDCVRKKGTLDICRAKPDPPPTNVLVYTFVILGVVLIITVAVNMCIFCRKQGKPGVHVELKPPPQVQQPPPPKVLVIYSQDHYLYRDIVLKLCAFLQDKCGAKVVVDLLDTTMVGVMGRLRWLEWQRQQLKNPSDKVLVLCSRGVQAKWRALCGQGQVTLREDLLSPTDDMLIPFLHLFLPDMHQAGMLGKYMVAYFDDISSVQDIPSVFDVAVKYKLMKHFEELYFRLLDTEKYQPDHVKHVQGIGGDEYFNCPSGRALKDAIETFQAYQLENCDWFEKECVGCEEEVLTEADRLVDPLPIPPVLQCVPLIRNGPPVYVHEVEISENDTSIHVLTPELNPQHSPSSVAEITPILNPEYKLPYPSNRAEGRSDHMYPRSPESVYTVQSAVNCPPSQRPYWLSVEEGPLQIPNEDDEDDSLAPSSQISAHLYPSRSALQDSLGSNPSESSFTNMQGENLPSSVSSISCSLPVEVEEEEVLGHSGKGPNSGSDQGYISKMSSQHEPTIKENPLVALARLQEALFQQNLIDSDLLSLEEN